MADDENCKKCQEAVPPRASLSDQTLWVSCDDCKGWFHIACLDKDEAWLDSLGDNPFFCFPCLASREEESDEEQTQSANTAPTGLDPTRSLPSLSAASQARPTSAQESPEPSENAPLPVRSIGPSQRTGEPLAESSQNSQDNIQPKASGSTIRANIRKGHDIVKKAIGHEFSNRRGRQFRVEYENGEKLWHFERVLYCLGKVDAYCATNKLPKSKFTPKSRMGATLELKQNPANWLNMSEVLRLAKCFGIQNGLEPTEFAGFGSKDGIYIHQLGEHAYVFLWIPRTRTCYIADGLNTYIHEQEVREDLAPILSTAIHIRPLLFTGQKFADHCASSAAALATEFQRLHLNGLQFSGSEIQVPKSRLERIGAIAHKFKSERVNEWKPIKQLNFGITCPECGEKMRGKNRSALNFHKCKN